MTGVVDAAGRALLRIQLRPSDASPDSEITAWVDTAFDGELVMPRTSIEALGLRQTAAVSATLADGTTAILETFDCVVAWRGADRHVEVVANDGRFPLLGIGLLRETRLVIDYRQNTLVVD